MYIYIYIYVCIYIYLFIYIYIHTDTYMGDCLLVCLCAAYIQDAVDDEYVGVFLGRSEGQPSTAAACPPQLGLRVKGTQG